MYFQRNLCQGAGCCLGDCVVEDCPERRIIGPARLRRERGARLVPHPLGVGAAGPSSSAGGWWRASGCMLDITGVVVNFVRM